MVLGIILVIVVVGGVWYYQTAREGTVEKSVIFRTNSVSFDRWIMYEGKGYGLYSTAASSWIRPKMYGFWYTSGGHVDIGFESDKRRLLVECC